MNISMNRRIAEEVTVMTWAEHELGNVLKCLSAGYDQALVVSPGARHLNSVK